MSKLKEPHSSESKDEAQQQMKGAYIKLFADTWEAIAMLKNEQLARMMRAIAAYRLQHTDTTFEDATLAALWLLIKKDLDYSWQQQINASRPRSSRRKKSEMKANVSETQRSDSEAQPQEQEQEQEQISLNKISEKEEALTLATEAKEDAKEQADRELTQRFFKRYLSSTSIEQIKKMCHSNGYDEHDFFEKIEELRRRWEAQPPQHRDYRDFKAHIVNIYLKDRERAQAHSSSGTRAEKERAAGDNLTAWATAQAVNTMIS